ncbi:hypothetical protein [Streptomyces sp. NPDC057686]|uniref:hypothetical protein n=1 Tax=Streptomyces sp. NPDC057686 TaxID=3346212 RepID=UPI0036CA064C
MEHTFPGFRSVGWTMTTANHSAILPQGSESNGGSVRAGATRVGKWTYTPVSTDWAPNESATLHREGREVGLHYSSSLFEDFLETMSAIENDFGRRLQEAASIKPSAGERSGRNYLV